MSDAQKPIKNSLLSAATSSNFFEDAALFVPVPLAEPEPQQPATAEIDLNSDDSSPNRASVEREFEEQLTLSETVQEVIPPQPQIEEQPAAISLFSRAATSGGDLFSRMLAGSSAPKADTSMTNQSQSEFKFPVVPPSTANTSAISLKVSEEEEATPSVVSLFSAPVSRLDTSTPLTSHTDFLSSPSVVPVPQTANQGVGDEGEVVPAASLFSPGSAFVPTNLAPRSSPSFQPINAPTLTSSINVLPPSFIYQGSQVFPGNDSVACPLPTRPSLLTSIPASMNTNPLVPLISSNPQSNAAEGLPMPPSQSVPPIPSGNSNAFRLGGQRMKYVTCPEMQSVQSPVATPPQNLPFSPMVGCNPALTSTPSYNPPLSMGSSISSSPMIPQQGIQTGSSIGMYNGQSFAQNQTTPSRPPVNVGSHYGSPPGHIQAYGPQELPPLTYHWFYRKDVDGKTIWKPFSIIDSVSLEDAYSNEPERLVPTDGGRYDVCVQKRIKTPVYWEETPIEVRRGSWFFKGPMDNRFIPYDEDFAVKLESEYADCMRTGVWQKRLEFPDGESVIMHSAGVVVHFCQAAAPDDWGNLPESQIRPRVVKRGVDEIEVEDGESPQIDHLVFVVHGIGPICDFKLRNIVEAVDDFRGLSFQLLHSHFRESIDKTLVGRVEFLPVSWHKALHGDKGIDEQLKRITLRSIPKFRDFTNDTLLDILFYTSPVYCQTIINSVGSELNRIYKLFLSRNTSFQGKVSLTGHSLGSLILFDLLAHQPVTGSATDNLDLDAVSNEDKEVELTSQEEKTEEVATVLAASSSRTVSYTVGTAGTGQPYITYPKIDFSPCAFFALGSPIAMFVTVRGIEKLGNDFRLPTCPAFFNIFHPYDPVAYRIETLIDPDFQNRPVLIPHHKGRKRIHLELKETMARVGADIKHKVIDAVKSTINTVYHYTGFSKTGESLDNEIQSAIAGEMEKKAEADGAEDENAHIRIGSLNGGRRIDHVLQEAPYETFNEYVFAMSTHVGYWESEDTMLLILTEVYGSMGIQRDRQVVGAQGVTSPTHPVPSGPNNANYYPSPSASSSNANFYPSPVMSSHFDASAYQPSAPPMQTSAHVQTSQSMFNMSPSVVPQPAALAYPPQPVPMMQSSNAAGGILLPPNPVQGTVVSPPSASGSKPQLIGNRPVTDPSYYPRGMDPTAPMLTLSQVAPPPKTGFVPKPN